MLEGNQAYYFPGSCGSNVQIGTIFTTGCLPRKTMAFFPTNASLSS
jgi:hypothetical protein